MLRGLVHRFDLPVAPYEAVVLNCKPEIIDYSESILDEKNNIINVSSASLFSLHRQTGCGRTGCNCKPPPPAAH